MDLMRELTHQTRHPRGSSPFIPPGQEGLEAGGVGWIQARGGFLDDETGPDTINYRSALHSYSAPEQGANPSPEHAFRDEGE